MTGKTWKWYSILALIGTLCAGQAFAREMPVQATVFLVGIQRPIVISDFTINGERFYDAARQGKKVKLPFRDLKEIRFLSPAKSFEAEVLFNDGKKETVLLQPAADIVINTGTISMHSHTRVARIQFAPLPAQPPPGAQEALRQPRPDADAPMPSDRVILRNGDRLSGHILTTTFPVRTAYGTFRFEAARIASIEFDASRPDVAVVLLKNGDRLSGTVEVESVRMTTPSGEGISFDGTTIQRITFKR